MTVAGFWTRTVPAGSCIEWRRGKNSKGYGYLMDGGRSVPAHRWIYERLKGPIPDGLHIDHLCRNHACVNPDHLEAVTCKTNLLRGESFSAVNAKATTCAAGHPLEGENLLVDGGARRGRRRCRICAREQQRAWRARKRGLSTALALTPQKDT